MRRDSVRQQLKEEPRVIEKNPGDSPMEQYHKAGLQAHYDSRGQLELVEFYPEASVEYAGVGLLGRRLHDVRCDLARIGLFGRDDGLGDILYDDTGFGLYVEGDDIASVSVFTREYAHRELAGGGS
jgi:hypothetical protein